MVKTYRFAKQCAKQWRRGRSRGRSCDDNRVPSQARRQRALWPAGVLKTWKRPFPLPAELVEDKHRLLECWMAGADTPSPHLTAVLPRMPHWYLNMLDKYWDGDIPDETIAMLADGRVDPWDGPRAMGAMQDDSERGRERARIRMRSMLIAYGRAAVAASAGVRGRSGGQLVHGVQ